MQAQLDMGRAAANWYKTHYPMSRDKAMCERVQRIGQALVARLEPKAFPYEFNVVADPVINACAYPGGFLFFNEGLLSRFHDDSALACVIAHEIIHAAHRHAARAEDKMLVVGLIALMTAIATKDANVANRMMVLTRLSYSREDEYDADLSGIELVWLAGYDPVCGQDVMKLFTQLDKGNTTPDYLRTHPRPTDRLRAMQKRCAALAKRTRPVSAQPQAAPPPIASKELVGDIGKSVPIDSPWFPLGVGIFWIYSVTGTGGESQYKVCVAAVIPTEKGTLYRLETTIAGKVISSQVMTTKTEVWRRSQLTTPDSPWKLDSLFDVPPEGLTIDGYIYSLVGLETIDLPCGRFSNARHIRRTGGTPAQTLDYWFAENVGLVKRACLETGITETLARYIMMEKQSSAPDAGGAGLQGGSR
ncbi:MAG: M48 family metalloprotease [Armatimonadota bacterium]